MNKLSLKNGLIVCLAVGNAWCAPAHTVEDPAVTYRVACGEWELTVDRTGGTTDITKNRVLVIGRNRPAFKSGDIRYDGSTATVNNIDETDLNDDFGNGKQIRITSSTAGGTITMTQHYYLYSGKDYILTDLSIESASVLESNYMAPVRTEEPVTFLEASDNRTLFVPYDNDKWVRYNSIPFGSPSTSYEVGAFYNTGTRKGLIVGSVEHTLWKTGITAQTEAQNKINSLEVYGGITSYETRDVLPHGKIKGNKITSPKIMIGYFDDWRDGMETYGDLNNIVAPMPGWNGGTPFCWNSWGAIQTKLSYTNANEVSQYIAGSLQPAGFSNDGTVYVGLDSYWDNITYGNLLKFVKNCKTRGQKAGIYWTPFVDWACNPERVVEGTDNVKYKDIYLYADGQPQSIAGAYAIDPTHPATRQRIDLYLNRFIAQGFEFIKLDFMTHGSLESDSHYDPDVFTGIQAYNSGLQYILDILKDKMFINFSISPLFPSCYTNGRRIGCDAYGKISDTEYTLNSLTHGWWLNRVYRYNDADNIVLNGVSLGENRARITSSVITGLVCSGDDFSAGGYPTAKERAGMFLTKPEINKIARYGKSFRPVEGGWGEGAADMFVSQEADTLYLAVFNYTVRKTTPLVDFGRIGLVKGTDYVVHELWSDEKTEVNDSWTESVVRRDVKLFKIYPGTLASVPDAEKTANASLMCYPNPCNDRLYIADDGTPATYTLLTLQGNAIRQYRNTAGAIGVSDLQAGYYLLTRTAGDGTKQTISFIKK